MDTLWLLLVAAVVGLVMGTSAGLALGRSTRGAGHSGAAPGSTLEADGVVPVLAALRSTVVVLDDDDEVLRASAAAYTFNIVRDDEVCEPQVAAMVARVRATGQAQDAEITVARGRVEGAGQFYLRVRVARIARNRVLVLIEDRTAAKRVEDMRRDFVVNVSHELKTPVGAIALLAETVQNNVEDPELVRDYSTRVRKETERLGVLVQEIIELSRLQEGDALVEPEEVELDAVVAESLDRVRVEAEAKEVRLVSGGTPGLYVLGDASLIATAVRNLLDNAIRYSDPRTRVSVGVGVDPSDPELVRIAVVDQGIGIAKEAQERVFERFYRVDKARSRATGGTGLGLSIVKHVAADHGGTVELWSTPGRGSTFTLVLPRHRVERSRPPTEPEVSQARSAVASGAAGAAFAAIAAISDPQAPGGADPRQGGL
ncbi:MAG: ATP-binding protein [Actinomyces sp.]|uniref:sensor histidine kinase n=1 Tax=Actinomyces sp. TaxID=29317 RepID=UPI0026DB271B|nr:ATP-binding protein [Actinomyces sp.]MDO4243106.1 ATP-binding protein [Actinomyces sp.]